MHRNAIQTSLFALSFLTVPVGLARADGAVYSMTNALGNNQVLVYHRAANGNLTDGNLTPAPPIQTISTGGGGSGLQLAGVDSLGSAGSIQLDATHSLLFVVNTETAKENNGSGPYNQDCNQGTITSFLVAPDGTLKVANHVSSGGLFPNSLTVTKRAQDELLYVLNAGGPGLCNVAPNITGFRVAADGTMTATGSSRPLDPGPAFGSDVNCPPVRPPFAPPEDFQCGLNPPSFPRSPAQVRFSPDGNQLVVTIKGTNTIWVFPVNSAGAAGAPTISQAPPGGAAPGYFGFVFDKFNHLLVTELFGAAPPPIPTLGAGAVSSFTITPTNHLARVSSHVGDLGSAACWIALEPQVGHFAYVANNLSNNISAYATDASGVVTLVASSAGTGAGPNDLAIAQEAGVSYLYVVDAGDGTVGAFRINRADGSLTPLSGGSGLPSNHGAQGIAAY